jgi:hypothetical protein
LRRQLPRRVRANVFDRAIFVCLYRYFPDIGKAVAIIRPETVIRWHRMGPRAWWRWKSRNRGGRPKIDRESRDLVRRMCEENPLWGAPRIHDRLKFAPTARFWPNDLQPDMHSVGYRDLLRDRFSTSKVILQVTRYLLIFPPSTVAA